MPTAVATIVAFVSGYVAIAWLLRYLAHHSLAIFVAYRIPLGILVIALAASGAISYHGRVAPTTKARERTPGQEEAARRHERCRSRARRSLAAAGRAAGEDPGNGVVKIRLPEPEIARIRGPASLPSAASRSLRPIGALMSSTSGTLRVAVIDHDSGFVKVLAKRLDAAGWQHRVLGGASPPTSWSR